jgi:Holliday junction resolvase-like predicted endonuclease
LAETPWKLGQKRSIVLVEVKTVSGSGFGGAVDLVRYRKQLKLKTLARALEQEYPKRTIRIDVVGVDGDRINHIENAVN